MSRKTSVAVVQTFFTEDRADNIARLTDLVRGAASEGANVVLLPELFEGPYFPTSQREEFFSLAKPTDDHRSISHFSQLASELSIVIPVSFYEKAGQSHFNSVAILDADGANLGTYRKSHIPDGPGYQEKFYFRPGDTGFKSWNTRHGNIGVAICWDQWFPEAARAMVLDGADVLLYPTAIGSEPHAPDLDTRDRWRRAMVGHAVSNSCIVAAANRVGAEGDQTFYGSSFIANHAGDIVAELDREQSGFAIASIDSSELQRERAAWGFFRDRRPDLYKALTDGEKS